MLLPVVNELPNSQAIKMVTIAEAVLAEDAALLVSLLSALTTKPAVEEPSAAAVSLAASSLALRAALDSEARDAAAENIARETLHGSLFGGARGTSRAPLPDAAVHAALDGQLAELHALWNAGAPAELRAAAAADLPAALRAAEAHVAMMGARAARLRGEAAFAGARATSMRVEAAREAVAAVERDVAERAGARSAGNAAAAKVVARGNAVTAKLRLLRAQTAAELYTPVSVPALRAADAVLRERIEELEPHVAALTTRLAELRAAEADPRFAEVVREYRRVRQTLEEKEWSMKELGVL